MNDSNYGQVVSVKEAGILTDNMLPGMQADVDTEISALGNALWSYKFEHKINGIPVATTDCNLPIDREDLLYVAFQLDTIPKSTIFWMSPEDNESIEAYDALLARVYNGNVIIVDELKQYDQTKGKFMVWIRYNEMQYSLHKRFTYLREDIKHE